MLAAIQLDCRDLGSEDSLVQEKGCIVAEHDSSYHVGIVWKPKSAHEAGDDARVLPYSIFEL